MDSESISIDPLSHEGGGDLVLISHAHGDHLAGFKSKGVKLCTPETVRLYTTYYKGFVSQDVVLSRFFRDDEVAIQLHSSGHILGSAQFHLQHREYGSLVYTGDLNLEGTIINGPGERLECDEIVIDATFGHPHLRFPSRDRLYDEISSWVREVVKEGGTAVLYAHPIGKAQELVKLINEYLGLDPLVDNRIALVNKIYEEAGVKLSYLPLSHREAIDSLRKGGCALITSLRVRPKAISAAKPSSAIVTGWATVFSYVLFDKAFPLSAHSSFPLLLEYVKSSGAKTIYTVGYYAEEMSKYLRKQGFNSQPLARLRK
ncbi:MAG: hypothetical protein DRJ97_03650 [Thermoprotei archaeon]|nr:MAG: hypothetical protein DRJ97_03650 [Thermoprotei archaeon]